jgi:hypothetical protein
VLGLNQYDLQTLHNISLVHYRRLQLDDSIACAGAIGYHGLSVRSRSQRQSGAWGAA